MATYIIKITIITLKIRLKKRTKIEVFLFVFFLLTCLDKKVILLMGIIVIISRRVYSSMLCCALL